MTMEVMNRYVRERNEAFLSLDKKKILKFCKEWHICAPKDETVFWCGVHKVIVNTDAATEEQKRNSLEWLKEHGFSPDVFFSYNSVKLPKLPRED